MKAYDIPSCWSTSMPEDIEKLTNDFSKLKQ